MNNQFDNLMYEAGITAQGCWDEMDEYDRTAILKFANMIVGECMRMCEVTEMSFVTHDCDVEASGAITVKQFIAEHFGVEE